LKESNQHDDVWTVAEAKARLSEILRLASGNPQYIGAKKSHVIVLAEEWEKTQRARTPMGQWLVSALNDSGDLELPDRAGTDREIPFDD